LVAVTLIGRGGGVSPPSETAASEAAPPVPPPSRFPALPPAPPAPPPAPLDDPPLEPPALPVVLELVLGPLVLGPLVVGPLVLEPLPVALLLVPEPAPEVGPLDGVSLPQPPVQRAAIVAEQVRNWLVRVIGPFG
jgi:hypothetical protein